MIQSLCLYSRKPQPTCSFSAFSQGLPRPFLGPSNALYPCTGSPWKSFDKGLCFLIKAKRLLRLNKKLLKSTEVITQWLMVHLLLLSSAWYELLHYVAQMLCSSTTSNNSFSAERDLQSSAFLSLTAADIPLPGISFQGGVQDLCRNQASIKVTATGTFQVGVWKGVPYCLEHHSSFPLWVLTHPCSKQELAWAPKRIGFHGWKLLWTEIWELFFSFPALAWIP